MQGMKQIKYHCGSLQQLRAVLYKDVIVRWRQKWLTAIQILWPCAVFLLIYLIRLKYGREYHEACQFPSRLLPTKGNTLPGYLSYICTLENRCSNTETYNEHNIRTMDKAPLKYIVDIVQILINHDGIYNAIVNLPETGNFITTMTTVITSGHFAQLQDNIVKVVKLIPSVMDMLNGSFDIKTLFSDRETFVKAGNLMCGAPFPSTETIPLLKDILHSDDFSAINDDELQVMPTPYCKRLYLDITSSNYGKITWNTIKPIIQGKILYTPNNKDTKLIMQFANSTFEEIERLKVLTVTAQRILDQLRGNSTFQKAFDTLLTLASSHFVQSLIGDNFHFIGIQNILEDLRFNDVVYDIVSTIKDILQCYSSDRLVGVESGEELRRTAFALNKHRMFYAGINFNQTSGENIVYQLHMDTDNTQPTFENRNRFWFPGPKANPILDLKYHRSFIQIKHSIDLALIKYKKTILTELGLLHRTPQSSERSPTASNFSIEFDIENSDEDYDDSDWFSDTENTTQIEDKPMNNSISDSDLISSLVDGIAVLQSNTTNNYTTWPLSSVFGNVTRADKEMGGGRVKRQSFLNLLFGKVDDSNNANALKYEVDDMKFFTKQFPYPAYQKDNFKVGIYLAQGIQIGFLLGLLAEISLSVRHLIWMRESRNSMIMRSMGLKPYWELGSWILITFLELFCIFVVITIILYINGLLLYTHWLFILAYQGVFGCVLISFCYMCSIFFKSASIGSVAVAVIFFITYCPYILVLLFDAELNTWQNVCIHLSFTTAFSTAWRDIMRLEVQEIGYSFKKLLEADFTTEFAFALFMMIFDMLLYIGITSIYQMFHKDENDFVKVQKQNLDRNIGARLINVSKIYDGEKIAISNLSLTFYKNQVSCLLGRNGAGKSTVIKLLTGQQVQSAGRVILAKRPNDYSVARIGVCTQDNILIPNLTVHEHLQLYARIKLNRDFNEAVKTILKNLNFGKYENYQVYQLSGGYQRRLCVAIAFLGTPNVVVLDEPCNGVDAKARKDIWQLIERLRIGSAVIFISHFLDEAEHLSDQIIIMKNGRILAEYIPETLKAHCTSYLELSLECNKLQTLSDIYLKASQLLSNYHHFATTIHQKTIVKFRILYDQLSVDNYIEFLKYLEGLMGEQKIRNLHIQTVNLEELFQNINNDTKSKIHNNNLANKAETKTDGGDVGLVNMAYDLPLTRCQAVYQLLWKRFIHFSRDYWILASVIILPAILQIFAMWFIAQRVEDDYDKSLKLSRDLYSKTTQMLSIEMPKPFAKDVYENLQMDCYGNHFDCQKFNASEDAFYWLLNTLPNYRAKRYGGYSFNMSQLTVWYNNKGYHALVAWLNDLNTKILQTMTNNTNYSITTYNEPWKLSVAEFSTTSILRSSGDSILSLILLTIFALIVAVASVYLVNERVRGEKLQQKLCGVDAITYWSVAFVWDYFVLILAIAVCSLIILIFDMPVFSDRQQLSGIIVLALCYGFAAIPSVHVFEKGFSEACLAIVTIFVANIFISLMTLGIIVIMGIVGDTPVWDDWRHFLNRAFLIFPQHALGDGLLEICKSYFASLILKRYDIDTYKNPINSDLLKPHFIALLLIGILFFLLNICIETGKMQQWKMKLYKFFNLIQIAHPTGFDDLRMISIPTNNQYKSNNECNGSAVNSILMVKNLCKYYGGGGRHQCAVHDVTFSLKAGECFGLLGKNGAGKSTIFRMLSGEMPPSSGEINSKQTEISYCPQLNTLDNLLTVKETIKFYGHLRRVQDVHQLCASILKSYQLEEYENVLVRDLSGGNRRKLTMAVTCCGRTSLVLMDEPTSDMDPMTRTLVYRNIENFRKANRSILLTSHSLAEIENICQHVLILKKGRTLISASLPQLMQQFSGFYYVTLYGTIDKMTNLYQDIIRRFVKPMDIESYAHSMKFRIEIAERFLHENEMGNNYMEKSMFRSSGLGKMQLSELFQQLIELNQKYDQQGLRYAVSKCQMDTVFEIILAKCDETAGNNLNNKSAALIGSPSTGYTHNGYVETETAT